MASVKPDRRTGIFQIRFRLGGTEVKRSLQTRDPLRAELLRAEVDIGLARIQEYGVAAREDTGLLRALLDGTFDSKTLQPMRFDQPPPDEIQIVPEDPSLAAASLTASFRPGLKPLEMVRRITDTPLVSEDETTHVEPVVPPAAPTVSEIFQNYRDSVPSTAKAKTTLSTERVHFRHFCRILGEDCKLSEVTVGRLQAYINARAQEKYRGRPIGADTIRKEIDTIRLVWNWAQKRGLAGPEPFDGLRFPRRDEKPRFLPFAEVEARLKKGGASDHDSLSDSIYLSYAEVTELIEHVRHSATEPLVLPLFAIPAFTGARRSEVLRSEVQDWDLDSGTVEIREKKRVQGRSLSYRNVPVREELKQIMQAYFDKHHSGGKYAIEKLPSSGARRGKPRAVTLKEASEYFRKTLEGSRWEILRGFHVFRHSLASNLASQGIDQRIIDEILGHQTDEMRQRYRHLFPQRVREAMESLTAQDAVATLSAPH